jgi:hypothetical protein
MLEPPTPPQSPPLSASASASASGPASASNLWPSHHYAMIDIRDITPLNIISMPARVPNGTEVNLKGSEDPGDGD